MLGRDLLCKGVYLLGRFTSAEKFMFCTIFMFLTLFCYYYIFFLGYDGLDWCDFITQRAVCEQTIKGTEVYLLRGDSETIYMGFHAIPWGCILGNIFYPAFLSVEAGKIYFLTLNITVLIICSYVLYRKIKPVSYDLGLLAAVMSVLSVDFLFSIYMGNGGAVVCMFMLIAWAVCDEHPIFAGVLTGLAMIKPQTAALMCLTMLLMKRVKPLIVGAVIDVAAWFIVSVMTKRGMFELISEFLFSSDKLSDSFQAGIFTLAFNNGLIAMACSMLLGIIFVLMLHICIPENLPQYFKIYPAMLAANFWCYGNFTDSYILIIPAVICLWLITFQSSSSKRFMWFSLSLWCSYGPIIRSVLRRFLYLIYKPLPDDAVFSIYIPRTIHEVGLLVIGILICLELRKTYSEVRS